MSSRCSRPDGTGCGQAAGTRTAPPPTDRVAGDKGYSSPPVRRYLEGRGSGPSSRPSADKPRTRAFDRAAYRERNVVERLINRLKQWRRVATRYEKRGTNYLAMLTVAAILLWL